MNGSYVILKFLRTWSCFGHESAGQRIRTNGPVYGDALGQAFESGVE